jgi:hypothetical protein
VRETCNSPIYSPNARLHFSHPSNLLLHAVRRAVVEAKSFDAAPLDTFENHSADMGTTIQSEDDDELTQRVCTVGGNAVSAFLSWRLSATNACDVTLVWKQGYESVSQYGISFRYGTINGVIPVPILLLTLPADRISSGTSASSRDTVRIPMLPHTDASETLRLTCLQR